MAGHHIRTQFTCHFDTILFRHHHITDNNIRQILQRLAPTFHSIGSFHHPVHRSKYAAQELTPFLIIFNQQHQLFGVIFRRRFFLRRRFLNSPTVCCHQSFRLERRIGYIHHLPHPRRNFRVLKDKFHFFVIMLFPFQEINLEATSFSQTAIDGNGSLVHLHKLFHQ